MCIHVYILTYTQICMQKRQKHFEALSVFGWKNLRPQISGQFQNTFQNRAALAAIHSFR